MLLAIPLGMAIGLAVGALGGGGSVLAVPVFVYLLDQSVAEATTASLAVVAAGASAGAVSHARSGRVCWRHAASFTAAAIPGVVAGTLAGEAVADETLLVLFAALMLLAARATWVKAQSVPAEQEWEGRGACPPLRLPRDVAAGAAIGFVTGLLGVGGGFLIVPTLAIALAFTVRTAIGTSLAIITTTSLLGLVTHLLAGRDVDGGLTAAMAGACVAGALTGGVLAGRLSQLVLGRAFAVLVVAVSAYVVASVALLGGPPGS